MAVPDVLKELVNRGPFAKEVAGKMRLYMHRGWVSLNPDVQWATVNNVPSDLSMEVGYDVIAFNCLSARMQEDGKRGYSEVIE